MKFFDILLSKKLRVGGSSVGGRYTHTVLYRMPSGTIYLPYSSPYTFNVDEPVKLTAPETGLFVEEDGIVFFDHWEIAGKVFPSASVTDRPHMPGHYNAIAVYSATEKTCAPTIHIIRTYPEVIDGVNKIAVVASWANDERNYEVSQVRMELATYPDMSSANGSNSKFISDTGVYTIHTKIKEGKENVPIYLRAKMTLINKNTLEELIVYSEICGVVWSQMWDSI